MMMGGTASQDGNLAQLSNMCLRFLWSYDSAFAFVGHMNRLFLVAATTLSVLRCFLSLFRIVVVIEGADVKSLKL